MAYKNLRHLPIYQKALDLCRMSREIASYVSHNKDLLTLYRSKSHRDSIADAILTDAILIPQQIAQAECSDSHSIRMNSISFVDVMIQNISSYCTGLEKDGVKEKEYINLLREEVKSFRASFKSWRASLRNL